MNAGAQIHRELRDYWREFQAVLTQLRSTARIIPNNEWEVFTTPVNHAGVVEFTMNPVVFRVPLKANATSDDLIIVARGVLEIDETRFLTDRALCTKRFATQVAYFRLNDDLLTHFFGVHYDYADNHIGHPVFHAQIGSQFNLAPYAGRAVSQTVREVDGMAWTLQNIRIPIAQMDCFSLFLQIVADHLLWERSEEEHKVAFARLVQISNLQGAGYLCGRMREPGVAACMRSRHWYPS
jgi:hypothetical protein